MNENLSTLTANIRESEVLVPFKDSLFELGRIAVGLARVERATRLADGRHETDAEHSFHLSLTVAEVVDFLYPDLDPGLAAMFANVHELPELYAGDVSTFDITSEQRAAKEAAEKLSALRLYDELPPFTSSLLRRYEEQEEPESRLVRLIDKSVPAIVTTVSGNTNTLKNDYNVSDVETLRAHRLRHTERLRHMFPDFPEYFDLRQLISMQMEKQFFPDAVVQSDE